jgi:hypothetical protein
MTETPFIVDEERLFDVYSLLADACEAAATGDRNQCASKAADAKDELEALHSDGAPLEEER